MAYNKTKVILYGFGGILLALTILAFIPTQTETHITTGITLDYIPSYGIQIIKISEETTTPTELIITINAIEAQTPSGEWIQITNKEQKWDLKKEIETSFTIDQNLTGYTKLRFSLLHGIDKSYATLENGEKIPIGVPSIPLEIELSQENGQSNELVLTQSQGKISNYILPNVQVEISTNKITGAITQ